MFPDNRPIKIFYSYSHQDRALLEELEKQLSLLKLRSVITTWYDGKIDPGSEWHSNIIDNLNNADIILLLISPDFLNSEYAYHTEVKIAMERHAAGQARVIPVILRHVDDWSSAPYGKLQALPSQGKPVTTWKPKDKGYSEVARGIREIVEGKRLAATSVPEAIATPKVQSEIPPLLLYLCDRSEQEAELTAALRKHQTTAARRPFVCVVHGDERECHTEFYERMQYTAIPRSLNLAAKQVPFESYQFQWPSRAVPGKRYAEAFASRLGMILLQNPAALLEEMRQFIAGYERPVLLSSHLLTDDFLETGIDVFKHSLSFWNAWPDLPPGRMLVIWISIKHQTSSPAGFLQRWKLKRLRNRICDYLNALNFSAYERLSGVVLSELKGIRRTDVEAWTRSREVRQRWEIHEKHIRALYERPELVSADGLMPMESVADELRELINNYQHQRG